MDYNQLELAQRKGEWKSSEVPQEGLQAITEAHATLVGNAAWLNGEIPVEDLAGVRITDPWGNPTVKYRKKPYRGVLYVVSTMLVNGALLPSVELGLLMQRYDMVREWWGRR